MKPNIENYPNSAKAFDAFADYFMAIHDTTNAIANYKKALTINDDISIRNKLNSLIRMFLFHLQKMT
ncbi:MAG: hypothetical protein JST75_20945 [Bacteroidetes bacterium]|nr:hypothetical protein [Bacteroidota bacterium]